MEVNNKTVNIPKKLAFSFQAILNRFFSIIQTDNPRKLLTLQYMNKKLIQNKSMLVFKD